MIKRKEKRLHRVAIIFDQNMYKEHIHLSIDMDVDIDIDTWQS